MTAEQRIRQLGLVIAEPAPKQFDYDAVHIAGDFAFLAGQIPKLDRDTLLCQGAVGGPVSLEQACDAARLTVCNGLAWLRQAIGTLDRVGSVARLTAYVVPAPDFHALSKVADAASQLLVAIFGPAGAAPRSVIGAARLPYDAPVLLEMTFQLLPKQDRQVASR
jgi:enamine deaminase RidA (YjgF/YER057c/UK114 family)